MEGLPQHGNVLRRGFQKQYRIVQDREKSLAPRCTSRIFHRRYLTFNNSGSPKNIEEGELLELYSFRSELKEVAMNSRKLIAEIQADGWVLIRVNGSHHHFRHPDKSGLVTVPHPKKDLPLKTAKSIRRQAGL